MSDTTVVMIAISMMFIGIGAFYAYRCWKLWNCIRISGMGVMVTKDRSFLQTNFKLVMVIGALISLHILYIELAEHFGLPSIPSILRIFYLFYYLKLVAIMSALLVLAISWYRLLTKVNIWDKRWIETK